MLDRQCLRATEPRLPDWPKIGQILSNLPDLELGGFLNLKIGQADLILIILRLRTRLSFAKQCCKDSTMEGDMLPRFRANFLYVESQPCPNHWINFIFWHFYRWSLFYSHVQFCPISLKFMSILSNWQPCCRHRCVFRRRVVWCPTGRLIPR